MGIRLPWALADMVKIGRKESIVTDNAQSATVKEGVMASLPFLLVFTFIILTSSLFPALNQSLAKSIDYFFHLNGRPC